MICKNCKKEIPEESRICPLCGQALAEESEEQVTAEEQPDHGEAAGNGLNQNEQCAQAETPEKKGKSRKLKIGIAVAAVVIVIALAVPVSLMAVRTYNYNQAVSLLKEEEYKQAKKIFVKLDDYKDSRKNVVKCNTGLAYEKASALVKKKDYEKAVSALEDLAKEDYKDSADLKLLCENKLAYANAQTLLDAGKYYDAYNAFRNISDFEDASEKAKSCVQPMPETGEIYRNEAYAAKDNPIKISRTAATNHLPLVLKITTADDTPVATVFMAAEEGYTINLPAGSYKITAVMGMAQWFGTEDMFGELSLEEELDSKENGGLYVVQNNYTYTLTL